MQTKEHVTRPVNWGEHACIFTLGGVAQPALCADIHRQLQHPLCTTLGCKPVTKGVTSISVETMNNV